MNYRLMKYNKDTRENTDDDDDDDDEEINERIRRLCGVDVRQSFSMHIAGKSVIQLRKRRMKKKKALCLLEVEGFR
jgi:hypothetical protein